jgi:hypothetical protein
LEGDPLTRILKENAKMAKLHKEATDQTNDLITKGLAEIKDNVLMMVGAP